MLFLHFSEGVIYFPQYETDINNEDDAIPIVMQSQRPYSARQRTPSSGRNNLSDFQSNEPGSTSRPRTASNASKIKFQPGLDGPVVRESIFAPSRYPTIPPQEPEKPRRLMRCPEDWLRQCNDHHWITTTEHVHTLDPSHKHEVSSDLIGRNHHRLWKFDLKYLNKTPHHALSDAVDLHDSKFVTHMRGLHKKEKVLNLSGSHNVHSCFKDDHLHPVYQPAHDPFTMSYGTSREAKIFHREKLLSHHTNNMEKKHNRGYRHLPEVNNFSTFNGILNTNKHTILNR